jgi:hypothetical protein
MGHSAMMIRALHPKYITLHGKYVAHEGHALPTTATCHAMNAQWENYCLIISLEVRIFLNVGASCGKTASFFFEHGT